MPCAGDNGDEEVDIDDHAPPALFPPVEIEKDAAVCASKSSSSSSSDSESASSDSGKISVPSQLPIEGLICAMYCPLSSWAGWRF